MSPFFAALGFLSILPLPARWRGGEAELARCLPWFPAVGLLIGGAATCLGAALGWLLPPQPAAALVVIAMFWISGGLHLDGLADTADGFFSARSRERMLEIMRDSRTGPMGVIAVVSVLIVKVAALASLPAHQRWTALLLAPLAGRTALVLLMAMLPYARSGGLATIFIKQRSRPAALLAIMVLSIIGALAAGLAGMMTAVATLAVVAAFAVQCRRKIGGLTGDTLGAACELAETAALLVAAAAAHLERLA